MINRLEYSLKTHAQITNKVIITKVFAQKQLRKPFIFFHESVFYESPDRKKRFSRWWWIFRNKVKYGQNLLDKGIIF